MTSTIAITKKHSPAPWTYEYSPYTMSEAVRANMGAAGATVPAFEVFDAEGDKVFDTNEDSPEALQEANARLAAASPELLLALLECVRLFADYDTFEGEEGEAYRRALAIIEQAR